MRTLSRAVLLVAGTALAGLLLMALLGYRPVVISSGSMTPTLHVGDLVVSRSAHPGTLRPGDIVTFHDPDLGGHAVTHRIVGISGDGAVFAVHTRGDANSVGESWTVAPDDSVGLDVAHVPYAGWWFLLLHSGIGRIGLVLLLCGWVAAESLKRVWATTSEASA